MMNPLDAMMVVKVYESSFNHYAGEPVILGAIPYDESWENSQDQSIKNIYHYGKQQGLRYKVKKQENGLNQRVNPISEFTKPVTEEVSNQSFMPTTGIGEQDSEIFNPMTQSFSTTNQAGRRDDFIPTPHPETPTMPVYVEPSAVIGTDTVANPQQSYLAAAGTGMNQYKFIPGEPEETSLSESAEVPHTR